MSVLNTKGRFYYPIVIIIHCGFFFPIPLQSLSFFVITSPKKRLCWVRTLSFYRNIQDYIGDIFYFYHISLSLSSLIILFSFTRCSHRIWRICLFGKYWLCIEFVLTNKCSGALYTFLIRKVNSYKIICYLRFLFLFIPNHLYVEVK